MPAIVVESLGLAILVLLKSCLNIQPVGGTGGQGLLWLQYIIAIPEEVWWFRRQCQPSLGIRWLSMTVRILMSIETVDASPVASIALCVGQRLNDQVSCAFGESRRSNAFWMRRRRNETWGPTRMRCIVDHSVAQVLIWGLEGSNVEACKNLVLAGTPGVSVEWSTHFPFEGMYPWSLVLSRIL